MPLSKKTIVLTILIPLVVVALTAGGYIYYVQIGFGKSASQKKLEKFGFEVIPGTFYNESTGELGSKQLPATFADDQLDPTQKVIKSLIRDNERLMQEKQELQDQIADFKQRLAELEDYQRLNEHFASSSIDNETEKVETEVKKLLVGTAATKRFNNIQIEIMAAASAVEYRRFVERERLILNKEQRLNIVHNLLPAFAFCIGDGVEIAANSRTETLRIAEYFRQEAPEKLSGALRKDLDTVLEPCQEKLQQQLATLFPDRVTGQ